MIKGVNRSRWVYILPLLHLFAYVATLTVMLIPPLQPLGIVGSYILLADLPVSLVAYMLAWKYSLLATIWILIVGTLWWYLLSLGINWVFDTYMERRAAGQITIRS